MKFLAVKPGLVVALVVLASLSPSSAVQITRTGEGPTFSSIGPLAFAPDGTLFAADTQGAAIVALDLGAQANGGAPARRASTRSMRSSPRCSAPARAKSPSPISPYIRGRAMPTCR